jgi:predicted dienelactone hydrolase
MMSRREVARRRHAGLGRAVSSALAIAVLCFAADLAHAAGIQALAVAADAQGPPLNGTVWSPCAEAAGEAMLRRLRVAGVQDCPVAGERLPLVVISHGRGGWSGGHHDIAAALADAGFIVAAIDHPGDTVTDMSRVDALAIWLERPAAIRRLIDVMLGVWPDAARIDRERIGFFGFSRGAYTGLAAVGGAPNFRRVAAGCTDGANPGPACERIRTQGIPGDAPTRDPRIKAAVLADPPTFLFGPDDLKAVSVPIQLWASEQGGAGVTREAVAAAAERLPPGTDFRVVPNSAHFAFMPPCSAGQQAAVPRICADPPGFDRAAFHKSFNADVLAFFRKHLADGR